MPARRHKILKTAASFSSIMKRMRRRRSLLRNVAKITSSSPPQRLLAFYHGEESLARGNNINDILEWRGSSSVISKESEMKTE